MPTFVVDKLIRDKIAQDAHWHNKRRLTDAEFLEALKKKLVEEAQEVLEAKTPEELCEELADVQDILDYLIEAAGLMRQDIEAAQSKKHATRGGFDERTYAEAIELEDGHRLVAYCRSYPDKYRELPE